MANLSGPGQVFHGNTAAVDSSAQVPFGSIAQDPQGGEWIYLQGTAAVAVGEWVVWDSQNSRVARLGAGAVGPVAVFGTAVLAGQYGWAQIYGKNAVAKSNTVSAQRQLFADTTIGRVDDALASGSAVIGAVSLAADSSNVLTVWLNYPYIAGTAMA